MGQSSDHGEADEKEIQGKLGGVALLGNGWMTFCK